MDYTEKKVDVYRNLHKRCFSVRHDGIVIDHLLDAESILLGKVKFVVQPAGRAKVLREKRKNVHAFVRGEYALAIDRVGLNWNTAPYDKEVTYNPYKGDTFYYKYSGFPILEADEVLIRDGKVWVR